MASGQSGETDLDRLIAGMTPEMAPGLFVFVTLSGRGVPRGLKPQMVFEEPEGQTLIILKSEAEAHGLPFEFPCRMITLNVHSSLAAVGFLARITAALAAAGIGVNPVSGFYHDHLFVTEVRGAEALDLLRRMAAGGVG